MNEIQKLKLLHTATEGPSYSVRCLDSLHVYGRKKTLGLSVWVLVAYCQLRASL